MSTGVTQFLDGLRVLGVVLDSIEGAVEKAAAILDGGDGKKSTVESAAPPALNAKLADAAAQATLPGAGAFGKAAGASGGLGADAVSESPNTVEAAPREEARGVDEPSSVPSPDVLKLRRTGTDFQSDQVKYQQWSDDLMQLQRAMYQHGKKRNNAHTDSCSVEELKRWCDEEPAMKQAYERVMGNLALFDQIIAKAGDPGVQGADTDRNGKIILRILDARAKEFLEISNTASSGLSATNSSLEALGEKPIPKSSSGAGNSAASQTAVAGDETPRPELSSKSGLEGAAENAGRISVWAESEYNRLSAAYNNEPDSAKQTEIKSRLDSLGRQMQSIANMQLQFETMISTILKLRADMAMSAIRNMQ